MQHIVQQSREKKRFSMSTRSAQKSCFCVLINKRPFEPFMSLELVDLIVTAACRCVHEKAERGVRTIELSVCDRDSRSNMSTGLPTSLSIL